MIKSITFILSAILLALCFGGCDKEEAIPSYIYIDSVNLETTAGQGSAAADFTTIQVFSGADEIGQFFLPARIPILEEGPTTLDFFAGVNDNGVFNTPVSYILLKPISMEVDLAAAQIDTLDLTFNYKDILKFAFIEGFESENQIFLEDFDGNENKLVLTDQDVFEGNRSGSMIVTEEDNVLAVGSILSQDLPLGGVPVYLEINYKSEIPLEIGISWVSASNGRETSFLNVINPKDEWGKIYINYTEQLELINNIGGIQAWQILLRARMPEENGTVLSGEREVLLDNIKLIHYK